MKSNMGPSDALKLLDLPDELLESILAFVPLGSLPACQSTCKKLWKLCANRLLWKHHLQEHYRYWHPAHDIAGLLNAPAIDTDWRHILATRRQQDQITSRNLDSILASQTGRIQKSEIVIGQGYDAKDVLLKHLACPDYAEDVLARRYYSNELLGSIARSAAIEEWIKLRDDEDSVPLERALGAFDLFIAERPPETLDEITNHLDTIADAFKSEHAEWNGYTPRVKAVAVVSFLRSHNLTGVRSQETYHDLQNNLISVALCEHDHPSLPLVSVAIFCCIAKRLGLDARLCGFPMHIHAIIFPESGKDMDNHSAPDHVPMYLDPFHTDQEIPVAHLRSLLSRYGISEQLQSSYLGASSTLDMVRRTAANIQESLQIFKGTRIVLQVPSTSTFLPSALQTSLTTTIDPLRALYASHWVFLLLAVSQENADPTLIHRHHPGHLNNLVSSMESSFRVDIGLLEQHILPMFELGMERAFLGNFATEVRHEDTTPPVVQRRPIHPGDSQNDKVKYKVGTLFHHKRYAYLGVITGWDSTCQMSDDWIAQMQVDRLPGGRSQSFYHAIVDDRSMRYVAEENIGLMDQVVSARVNLDPPEGLMRVAGKYFKRWDAERCVFVSNVRDQYPDD